MTTLYDHEAYKARAREAMIEAERVLAIVIEGPLTTSEEFEDLYTSAQQALCSIKFALNEPLPKEGEWSTPESASRLP